jgi:hypothetical protein
MKRSAVLLVAACFAVFVPPASADVRVTFSDGRVTIVATDATVPEILAEWARVGGSTFVDAEKIPVRERLTLRIEDHREIDALDVLLRWVAGYMVAPTAPAPGSASSIERVFILPTSTPAPYTPPPPEAAASADAPFTLTGGPPRPDDDGPVRIATPPDQAPTQQPTASPGLGQASPLTDPGSTQTLPGGAVTSSRPGVMIEAAQPRSRRPIAQPTRPRPGGGGGGR